MNKWQLSRLKWCSILQRDQIPCVAWFEDALRYYGVPTELFELYLLVPDIDQALKSYLQSNWTLKATAAAKIGNAFVDIPQYRLIFSLHSDASTSQDDGFCAYHPNSSERFGVPEIVLLNATDWQYTIPTNSNVTLELNTLIPPLPAFLDALIDSLLDSPLDNSMLWGHIACQIAYLYESNTDVMRPSFAESLRLEHRQYHFDTLSGMRTGTIPFVRHQRKIRNALRQGKFALCACSAVGDSDLFPDAEEKRLLALQNSRRG